MALSYNETGKYTSANHQKAKDDNKLTFGEAAKVYSKIRKIKTSAKELNAIYIAHFNRYPEWHHSGFYNGKMGKTYFITKEQLDEISNN